jgi:hypothetical protein
VKEDNQEQQVVFRTNKKKSPTRSLLNPVSLAVDVPVG